MKSLCPVSAVSNSNDSGAFAQKMITLESEICNLDDFHEAYQAVETLINQSEKLDDVGSCQLASLLRVTNEAFRARLTKLQALADCNGLAALQSEPGAQ